MVDMKQLLFYTLYLSVFFFTLTSYFFLLEWGIPGNNQLLWNAPKLAEGLVGGMRNTGGGTEWGERRTRAVDLLIASASIRCVGCGIGRIICIDPLHEETMRLNERNIVKAYTKKKTSRREEDPPAADGVFQFSWHDTFFVFCCVVRFRLHSLRGNDSRKR